MGTFENIEAKIRAKLAEASAARLVDLSGRGAGLAAYPVLSAPMDDQHLFAELIHAAARLGVEVRMEPFETPATMGGGLCVVRGETLVLIDLRAPLLDRIRALARALVELQSETVYMAPEARELIEALRGVLRTG